MKILAPWLDGVHAVVDVVQGSLLAWSLALAFVAVMLGVLGLAGLVRPDPVLRRMAGGATPAPTPAHPDSPLRDGAQVVPWERPLRALADLVPGRHDLVAALRARLARAGFDGAGALRGYVLARAGAAALAFAALALAVPTVRAHASPALTALAAVAILVAGLYVPGRWIAGRAAARRGAIAAGFPDALDMMVVCVEAGLGLDAALARVGGQIGSAHPALAEELGRVALELRAGQSRASALRNMARRADVREIAAVVTLLVQSDMLGTSIARALRVHAEEMRAARILRAEELAHALPVKLTVPLVVCILPALLAVVLLPGVIAIVRDVLPHMAR